MHTVDEVDRSDFEYRAAGRVVSRSEVMPSVGLEDRVGVVMGAGADGLGAGNFVLSCVTAFYEELRDRKEEFFEYPDYYTFQTTAEPADYGMLDVYPAHKNVTVEPDAEALLRAVNDRAITILLVPHAPEQSPVIEDVTRRSAERRITHCYQYAPDGQPPDPEFSIGLPREPAATWYRSIARSLPTAPDIDQLPPTDSEDTRIVQGFRTITLEEAIDRLPPTTTTTTGNS